MTDVPDPLTPPECDLRDFPYMPLDVGRLRDSDIAALSNGDEFRCAVLLWCASWHQIPAASLPDDDQVLANLAGFGRVVKEWKKVRTGSLRGWVKCADGRLYHPVVAEKARDAWASKIKFRDDRVKERQRKAEERARKKAEDEARQAHADATLSTNYPPDERDLSGGQMGDVRRTDDESPAENSLKGKGKGRVNVNTEAAATVNRELPRDPESGKAPPLPGRQEPNIDPSPAAALSVAMRKLGVMTTSMHPVLLEWVSKGVQLEHLVEAVRIARERKPTESLVPGYVHAILGDILNPPQKGQPVRAVEVKPWWQSVSGIDTKAAELGLTLEEGEAFPYFKLRVFAAAGQGPWHDAADRAAQPVVQGMKRAGSVVDVAAEREKMKQITKQNANK